MLSQSLVREQVVAVANMATGRPQRVADEAKWHTTCDTLKIQSEAAVSVNHENGPDMRDSQYCGAGISISALYPFQ